MEIDPDAPEWLNLNGLNSPSEPIEWILDKQAIMDRHQTCVPPMNSPLSSPENFFNVYSVSSERDNETSTIQANMSRVMDCSSHEVGHMINNASTDSLRRVALEWYENFKRNGLAKEAEKALREQFEGEELDGEGGDQGGILSEGGAHLVGMKYVLKDGFVSYLHEVAQITSIPQQVVRFSGIQYSRKFENLHSGYETFGKKLFGCFFGLAFRLLQKRYSSWMPVLKGIDGYVMPGSMTLLLGPPGSGKSSLLQILAGKAGSSKLALLEGAVMYNDKLASEVCLSRLVAFIDGQFNKHIPFLSIRETLKFARDCTQGLRPKNFTPQMRKFFADALVEGQDPFLEYVLEILGLKEIQHQLVGEELSESDHQKLTTAELALGTYAVMLYDQPPADLDPAAIYDLVDMLRILSRIKQSSAVMVLPEVSQETFNLFDRLVLLGNGQILYQGPRQDAVLYFAKLGYTKPLHVDSGAFLEDIASGQGSQYIAPGFAALSVEELAKCYKMSDHYKDVMRIVEGEDIKCTYWVKSEAGLCLSLKTEFGHGTSVNSEPRHEAELVVAELSSKIGSFEGIESTSIVQVGDVVKGISINNEGMQYLGVDSRWNQCDDTSQVYSKLSHARGHISLQLERYKDREDKYQSHSEQFQRPFIQTWGESTKVLIQRQMKIARQLHMLIKLRLFQSTVLGLFAGTMFYKMVGQYNQMQMNSVRALGFVSTMNVMLINLVQLPLHMLQRPIFYKQRSQRFFRASSFAIAYHVVSLPQAFLEALAYTICVYFLAGLSLVANGVIFLEYLLLLFLVDFFGSSLIFLISAISSISEMGSALAGLIVSYFLLFCGFVIYPHNIPRYWKWMYYINPLHHANLAFCYQQFNHGYARPCADFIDELPFCKSSPGQPVGKAYLAFNQIAGSSRSWLPYVVIFGWIIIIHILTFIALNKIEFKGDNPSLPQLKRTKVPRNYEENGANGLCSSSRGESDDSFMSKLVWPASPDLGPWMPKTCVDMGWAGLALPIIPMVLSFEKLALTRSNPKTKEISHVFGPVSGFAVPGTMLALIGGLKSSNSILLRCLAGHTPPSGKLTGELLANGRQLPSISVFSRVVGIVVGLEAHQCYLSVRESLQFSAGLRIDSSSPTMSRSALRLHVELVLAQLGLTPVADWLVGSFYSKKTKEIARKIAIAIELAANPSLLFLDNPTSGLDNAASLTILSILSRVSASGRIIISSLTHPSSRVLSLFQRALILSHNGGHAYFGAVGFDCKEILDFFNSIPKVPQYLGTQSPTDFVMDILGCGINNRKPPIKNFAYIYESSTLHDANRKEIINVRKRLTGQGKPYMADFAYPTTYIRQVAMVVLRSQRLLWRNVRYTFGRLIGCATLGLLMGSLYFQIEYNDIYGLTSRALYIYMQLLLLGVVSANNVIPQINSDRPAWIRERRLGLYAPFIYPISWAFAEAPYFLISSLVLVSIGNGLAGVATRSVRAFLTYWVGLWAFVMCSTCFGMMVALLVPTPAQAAFIVSVMMSMWVSTSGVLVLPPDIRLYYRALFWFNPFRLAGNVLTSVSFYCDTGRCRLSGVCSCPRLPDGVFVWDEIQAARWLNPGRVGWDILALVGMSVLFTGLASVFFVTLRHNSSGSR
ncbi:ABC transporter G family member 36 isoform X1 [Amborella trichopoda]|uniref:ABC transporter domain-containing protein n=1 Tax=Amborella trichopoda TaxID=13333 RepID=W1P6H4_AMBTC|nr:ABC transporter G family member 36 isoform X1 [Amborella trichopoda]ERN03264.1 hypothetical protein AMTR_s00003p00199390 [Amborella trichopoda]|eukprot:XP_020521301.1 ABC transporter G family member 36 isoform X1 [Amborella trichopoda]